MKELFVRCACHSADHQVVFSYDPLDPDDVYMEVHLTDYDYWWQRVWRAVHYIFGRPCRYGDWDEVLIGPDKAQEIQAFLHDFLKAGDKAGVERKQNG